MPLFFALALVLVPFFNSGESHHFILCPDEKQKKIFFITKKFFFSLRRTFFYTCEIFFFYSCEIFFYSCEIFFIEMFPAWSGQIKFLSIMDKNRKIESSFSFFICKEVSQVTADRFFYFFL